LYGDAARGCHHRGDGPDASQRVISYNRQRLGVLVIEARRRSPWDQQNPVGSYHRRRRKCMMAAKKKAAKKTAAKKKPAAKKKK
jgi:hypothetical protein